MREIGLERGVILRLAGWPGSFRCPWPAGEDGLHPSGTKHGLNPGGGGAAALQGEPQCRAVFEDAQGAQAFGEGAAPGKRSVAGDDGDGISPQVAWDALLHFGRAHRVAVDAHRHRAEEPGAEKIHRLKKAAGVPVCSGVSRVRRTGFPGASKLASVLTSEWQCTQALTPGRLSTRRWVFVSEDGRAVPSQPRSEKRTGTMSSGANVPHWEPDAVT